MRRARVALACLAVVAIAGCASGERAHEEHKKRPVVVLMTDFGTRDDAVALLKGVVLSIAPRAEVVDLCHEVPAYDIEAGAQTLDDAPGIFPAGTVFVAVVDPGVGTARKPIAVLLNNGSYLVGPDNGVLSYAMDRWGVKTVRSIENRAFMRGDISTTFHGRDVFSPAGADIAFGAPGYEEIGPEVKDWKKLERPKAESTRNGARGTVVAIDEPFGNLWTNIGPEELNGPAPPAVSPGGDLSPYRFELGDAKTKVTAPIVKTFGDVPEGKPLAYWNSRGRLSLAINMGDARKTYGIKRGDKVVVVSRE